MSTVTPIKFWPQAIACAVFMEAYYVISVARHRNVGAEPLERENFVGLLVVAGIDAITDACGLSPLEMAERAQHEASTRSANDA